MTSTISSQFTAKQLKVVQRVLDALDHWDGRLNDHYGRQRKHTRSTFRGVATLVVPGGEDDPPSSLQAFIRNVSPGGMAVIYPGRLTCGALIVGLVMGTGAPAWYHADVKRMREVQESFWEYGLSFRERAMMPDGPS